MAISAAGTRHGYVPVMINHAITHIRFPFSQSHMAESLQQLILDHLDTHGSIPDTRSLTPAADAEAQITILGALNSLLSREVPDLPSP